VPTQRWILICTLLAQLFVAIGRGQDVTILVRCGHHDAGGGRFDHAHSHPGVGLHSHRIGEIVATEESVAAEHSPPSGGSSGSVVSRTQDGAHGCHCIHAHLNDGGSTTRHIHSVDSMAAVSYPNVCVEPIESSYGANANRVFAVHGKWEPPWIDRCCARTIVLRN
jgi:hypothetical protein